MKSNTTEVQKKIVPKSEPYLRDPEYRKRCTKALASYYETFGKGRTLQGYVIENKVYLEDVIELMQKLRIGMPSDATEAKSYLKKIKGKV